MTTIGATHGGAATPLPVAGTPKSEREQLKEASKQFEAIFVRQMLAAARKTSFDEGGMFDNQAMDTFRQMQDEKFADTAAQTGAFGLASIIEAQLARHLPQATPPSQAREQQ